MAGEDYASDQATPAGAQNPRADFESRFRSVAQTASDAVITADGDGVIVFWNASAQDLFGYAEEEAVGQPLTIIIPEGYRDAHRAGLDRYKTTGEANVIGNTVELTGLRRDGTEFPVELSLGSWETAAGVSFSAIIRDITERKRAEQNANLLHFTALAAATTDSFDDALQQCLDLVCEYVGWPVGHVYVPAPDGSRVLISTAVWHLDDPSAFEVFREVTERTSFEPGVGLPGRVLFSGEAAWISDVQKDANFPRNREARDIGVRGAFAFPVKIGPETVAVLEFFTREPAEGDQHVLDTMTAVGLQFGRLFERKLAEEKYRDIFEQAVEGIFQTTTGGKFLAANPALARIFGYGSPDELVNSSANIARGLFVDAERRREFAMDLEEQGEVAGFECQVRRIDGTIIWVSISARAIRNAKGEVGTYEGRVEDITQRRRSEDALRASELRFRRLFEQSRDAMFVSTSDGTVIDLNDAASDQFGYTLEEAVGSHFFHWVADDANRDEIIQVMASGEVRDFATKLRRSEGSTFNALLMIGGIRDDEGNLIGVQAAVRDIDAGRRADDSERLAGVGPLVTGLAQNLKEPLSAIGDSSQRIVRMSQDEQDKRLARTISTDANRANRVIESLLLYSEQEEPRFQAVNLGQMLTKVIRSYRPSGAAAQSSRSAIVLAEMDQVPPVQADPAQLEVVFDNLVKNAWQAATRSKSNVTIEISAVVEESKVRVTVADDGPGIESDLLDRVFEPFFTTERQGSGLGLSICQGIVNQHRGRIWLDALPRKGAAFHVELGLAPQPREGPARDQPVPEKIDDDLVEQPVVDAVPAEADDVREAVRLPPRTRCGQRVRSD